MNHDETVTNVQRKIDREKALIQAANAMRQSTNNPAVLSRLDGQIRDGRRNIEYFEGTLRDLETGLAPPRAPYAGTQQQPKRANYSKLGVFISEGLSESLLICLADLIKYDTPHLGPRIQLMLSQLEFKLSVEKQYKDGIEKMVRLYQMEGDRKSKADAEARRIESNQKIQLLKQSLKRYEDLHVDVEGADGGDGKLF